MTDYQGAIEHPSSFYSHAMRGMLPSKIWVYAVAYETPEIAIEKQGAVRLAMHYYVGQDGQIVQAVPEEYVPNGSGADRFDIALCGTPHSFEQTVAFLGLLGDMVRRHNIRQDFIKIPDSLDQAVVYQYLATGKLPELPEPTTPEVEDKPAEVEKPKRKKATV